MIRRRPNVSIELQVLYRWPCVRAQCCGAKPRQVPGAEPRVGFTILRTSGTTHLKDGLAHLLVAASPAKSHHTIRRHTVSMTTLPIYLYTYVSIQSTTTTTATTITDTTTTTTTTTANITTTTKANHSHNQMGCSTKLHPRSPKLALGAS